MYLGALGMIGIGAGFLFAKSEDKTAAPKMVAPTKPAEKPQQTVGFINAQELTENYYRVTALNKRITDEYEAAQKQLDAMFEEYKALERECQKIADMLNNPTLSADAKKKLQDELDAKRQELERKARAIQEKKEILEQEILQIRIVEGEKIATLVKQRIREVALEDGFTMVIDQENPAVFFADERFNITKKVLVKLNADQSQASITTPNNVPATK